MSREIKIKDFRFHFCAGNSRFKLERDLRCTESEGLRRGLGPEEHKREIDLGAWAGAPVFPFDYLWRRRPTKHADPCKAGAHEEQRSGFRKPARTGL